MLIAVTRYGQPEDRQRSRARGIDHHLLKLAETKLLQSLLPRSAAASPTGCGSPAVADSAAACLALAGSPAVD